MAPQNSHQEILIIVVIKRMHKHKILIYTSALEHVFIEINRKIKRKKSNIQI